jgi:hypothetical protein
MVNIALYCANIQLEKRRKGLRNVFTMFLKIGGKKFYGYIICVCVCERERERERERETERQREAAFPNGHIILTSIWVK